MEKLGFIGMGNMAQALAAGFINAGAIAKEKVYAFAPNQEKLAKNAAAIGFTAVKTVQELADACDTLVMACKPYQIESVLTELGDKLKGKALISIAAGWDFARYESVLPAGVRLQFIMPNTPAMVGEGVLLFEEKIPLRQRNTQKSKNSLPPWVWCRNFPAISWALAAPSPVVARPLSTSLSRPTAMQQ